MVNDGVQPWWSINQDWQLLRAANIPARTGNNNDRNHLLIVGYRCWLIAGYLMVIAA